MQMYSTISIMEIDEKFFNLYYVSKYLLRTWLFIQSS